MKSIWFFVRFFSIIKIEDRVKRIQGCWQTQVIILHLVCSLSELQTLNNNISSIHINVRYGINRTTSCQRDFCQSDCDILSENKETAKFRVKKIQGCWQTQVIFSHLISSPSPNSKHWTISHQFTMWDMTWLEIRLKTTKRPEKSERKSRNLSDQTWSSQRSSQSVPHTKS